VHKLRAELYWPRHDTFNLGAITADKELANAFNPSVMRFCNVENAKGIRSSNKDALPAELGRLASTTPQREADRDTLL
jgi:hypothetical protein